MGWSTETIQPRGTTLIYFCAVHGNVAQIVNIPAGETEYNGGGSNKRVAVNLAGRQRCRFMLTTGVAGPTGSTMGVQYSLDNGNTWSTTFVSVSMVGTVTNPSPSAWTTIPVAGRTEVLLRVVTLGGDGTTDPNPNLIYLEVD